MPAFQMKVAGLPEVQISAGTTILVEGQRSGKVYILKSGELAVSVGGRELCRVAEPTTIFGEMSVLLDSPATATVTVVKDASFYVIDDLVKHLRSDADSALHVAKILASRVANMNNSFVQFKGELEKLQSKGLKGSVLAAVARIDEFWGRDVWDPLGSNKPPPKA